MFGYIYLFMCTPAYEYVCVEFRAGLLLITWMMGVELGSLGSTASTCPCLAVLLVVQ